MTLQPGTRLGSYEILAAVGAGGMGEVYRARDMKLGREVAIKVLPASFAGDPDRLARFRREAQVLASLNHPNIAQIYGVEDSDGVHALVMELVEGKTLEELIPGLPVPDALAIARQIAGALDGAHEKGIVHRDLKPANVKVTSDGTVKVLDFGLAKAIAGDGSGPDLSQLPTVTSAATREGTLLGTPAYMSPEQARGKPVDKRADIWAFGCVLYEMLTGRRPFAGETTSDTIAAILEREPDLTALPPATPGPVSRLLERCLTKDPRRRLRDIGDGCAELDAGAGPAARGAEPRPQRSALALVVTAAVAALAGALVAAGIWARPKLDAPRPVIHFSIPLPDGETITSSPAISRDGMLVAYTSAGPRQQPRLSVRRLDESRSREIPGSTGAADPFFSPDGREVAFFARGKLWKSLVSGGDPLALSDGGGFGASWGDDGNIVVGGFTGLRSIPAAGGGTAQTLTRPFDLPGQYGHVWPAMLPGGKEVLFIAWGDATQPTAVLRHSLETRRTDILQRVRWEGGFWIPSGHLLAIDDSGVVRATPFDPQKGTLTGSETPVLEDVTYNIGTVKPWLSVADNGNLVYAPGNPRQRKLVWVDRKGQVTSVGDDHGAYFDPVLSADGSRIAYVDRWQIWMRDLARNTRSSLIIQPDGPLRAPAWSADGSQVYFTSERTRDWDIYAASVTAPGSWRLVVSKPHSQTPGTAAPDGTFAYTDINPGNGNDIAVLTPAGVQTMFRATRFSEGDPRFSADGRWLAYTSNESGRNEVYVERYPRSGDPVKISSGGGVNPMWRRDGGELYYRAGDAVMAVKIQPGDGPLRASLPAVLFSVQTAPGTRLAAAPDGNRFLAIQAEPGSEPARLEVVLNWFEELKQRMAAAGR